MLDKSEPRIRRMFGAIAARYDFLNHLLSGGIDFYWRRKAVRTVPPDGDGPVLDVCTGTGDLALAYWKAAGGRVPVIGTDFTHEMLRLADRKGARISNNGGSRTGPIFLEADTQCLPLAENQFQVVSVAFGLRNVTETERGLREMARVCRPGGQVAVLEFSVPENRLLRRPYLWYFQHVLPRIGQWVSRNRESAYCYLPASVAEFPQGEQFAGLMRRCGFDAVRWKPLTFGVATLYWGDKPASESQE